MFHRFFLPVLLLCCCFSGVSLAQDNPRFPPTGKKPIEKTYFGTTVADNYSWLEKTEHPEVGHWVQTQTAYTDSVLHTIPFLPALEQNIRNMGTTTMLVPPTHKKYSLTMFRPALDDGNGAAQLFFREKEDRDWQMLIDPLRFRNAAKERVIITHYDLSEDSKYLAFALSRNGSDWNELRIMNMETRKMLNDSLLWLRSSFALWYGDGFFYKRTKRPDGNGEWTAVPDEEELCYHRLNTSAVSDVVIPVKSCLKVELIGNNLIIHMIEDNGRSTFYNISILDLNKDGWQKNKPEKFMLFPASIRYDVDVVGIHNDSVIVRNNLFGGNGMLASFNRHELNSYRVLIPEYEEIMVNAFFKMNKLHCLYRSDSAYVMIRYDLNSKVETGYQFGHYMSIRNFKSDNPSTAYYIETSYDRPAIQYAFDFTTYTSELIGATYVKYDVNNYVYKQLYYRASDSTEIPLTLFYKKGLKITDQTPVLLTAYGGFGVINDPEYDYAHILWAENGGIYAVAHIRGGGEKGKKWHIAGSRQHKQQGIADFIGAAQYLIDNKYTHPSRLAITGSSHGGLIVAGAVNQAPGLFKAAIPEVGVFDMFNYQDYTVGGRFADEFGTSKDSLSFAALCQYSPYHHINQQVNYPSTLVMTSDHDDRVPPFQSYKYAAALQQNPAQSNPVLLYVNAHAGHNGGTTINDEAHEKAYMLAFLFRVLNIKPKLMY